jgi:ABC-2 type transport system ATP-binding protein
MSEVVIQTHNLSKTYDGFKAVRELNLQVGEGEVYGLLGPNGAGKTTTILMLLGLTEPSSGQVRVLGMDPARRPLQVKARVGYLPEQVGFYNELTARENLIYIAKLNGLSREEGYRRIDEVLKRVGLGKSTDQKVGTFSRGMHQRLGVAEVLLKRPRLIIMDEPTQGLDPERAREYLGIIRELKAEGITILLCSHLLHQVQAVCDRVGLFQQGQLALEGSVAELARQVLGRAYQVILEVDGEPEAIQAALEALPGAINVRHDGERIYEIETESDLRADAARAVVGAGGELWKLDVEAQNLEDIYAHYFEEAPDDVSS